MVSYGYARIKRQHFYYSPDLLKGGHGPAVACLTKNKLSMLNVHSLLLPLDQRERGKEEEEGCSSRHTS